MRLSCQRRVSQIAFVVDQGQCGYYMSHGCARVALSWEFVATPTARASMCIVLSCSSQLTIFAVAMDSYPVSISRLCSIARSIVQFSPQSAPCTPIFIHMYLAACTCSLTFFCPQSPWKFVLVIVLVLAICALVYSMLTLDDAAKASAASEGSL